MSASKSWNQMRPLAPAAVLLHLSPADCRTPYLSCAMVYHEASVCDHPYPRSGQSLLCLRTSDAALMNKGGRSACVSSC